MITSAKPGSYALVFVSGGYKSQKTDNFALRNPIANVTVKPGTIYRPQLYMP